MTLSPHPDFETRVTCAPHDIRAAQRLRYDVFVAELGADGPMVDHTARLERDGFDDHAAHILLLDKARPEDDQVVGVYRVLTAKMAQAAGGFYCEAEYDLTPLYQSGRRLLELGRSCLHRDYRGGAGMLHLWQALAGYVDTHQIDVLFGVASFHGTDVQGLAAPLSHLHHKYLAPKALCVTAKGPTAIGMDMQPPETIDRIAAVRDIPALIKAYLRLGGKVGADAFVDHAFNTVDICLILEKDTIDGLQRAILAKGGWRG
ncbi:GNAT family N-acetyltransferase [Yoonia algicola]|uniref:L-ornithine N(alpha)-acyltransferase n=1 Tax=Yoonia algicola TaxID=3137368 RepID=A0AAN0M4P2_9RHOB